jgi:hypothetical protein
MPWDKEFRREFCMFSALVVGLGGLGVTTLNFTHNLGYWPYGNGKTAGGETITVEDQAKSHPGGDVMQWIIFALTMGSALSVGVLYYLGRKEARGNGGSLAAAYHEARAGELKEQVNSLTNEVARLNQHRIDLLGMLQAKEAKKDTAPPATVAAAPPRIKNLGANLLQSQREDMPLGNQIRIAFRNDCGHAISVSQPNWNTGAHGLHAYILGHEIHDTRSQWNPGQNSLDVLHVDPAAVFDVWVGIPNDYSLADLKNRQDKKILGVLTLTIDADKEAVFEL